MLFSKGFERRNPPTTIPDIEKTRPKREASSFSSSAISVDYLEDSEKERTTVTPKLKFWQNTDKLANTFSQMKKSILSSPFKETTYALDPKLAPIIASPSKPINSQTDLLPNPMVSKPRRPMILRQKPTQRAIPSSKPSPQEDMYLNRTALSLYSSSHQPSTHRGYIPYIALRRNRTLQATTQREEWGTAPSKRDDQGEKIRVAKVSKGKTEKVFTYLTSFNRARLDQL